MTLVKQQITRLSYFALYALVKRASLFFWPLLLVPSLIIALSVTAPKLYVNHASILIEESSLLNPFLDELSFSFELNDRMDALRTMVISRKNLIVAAEQAELIPANATLFQKEMAAEQLSSALSIKLVGGELVRIHFKWHQPEKMKKVLEVVVEQFIERLLAPTRTSLDTSETFFAEQLELIRQELEISEATLATFKQENRDYLPELYTSNQEALNNIERQRQIKSVEVSGAKAQLDSIKSKLNQANPVLGLIGQQILRAQSDLTLLRTRYTSKHSRVQAKVRELSNLKQRQTQLLEQAKTQPKQDMEQLWQAANQLPVDANGQSANMLVSQLMTLQNAKNKLGQLENEQNMLGQQAEQLTQRIASASNTEKELAKLERDYKVKSDLYQDLLGRYEMAKVSGKLVRYEGPDKIKHIERAYSPTRPIKMPLLITIILGLVTGIASGVGLVFVAELIDSRIKDISAVEKISGIPVVMVMPILDQQPHIDLSKLDSPDQLTRLSTPRFAQADQLNALFQEDLPHG